MKKLIFGLAVIAAGLVSGTAQAETLIKATAFGNKKVDTSELTPMGKVGSAGVFQSASKGPGGITFNIEFLDVTNNTNVGFDDATLGATRRTTVISIFNYLNTVLDYTGRTIDVQIANSETDGTGALAFAGTYFFVTPGYQDGFSLQRLSTGSKPAGGFEEIFATVDFGYNWNSETDSPTGSEFDLYSVMLHEFTHGLGMLALSDSSGSSGDDNFTRFEELFAEASSPGVPFFSGNPLSANNVGAVTGGADAIVFTGTNANTSFGSNPSIATPTPYAPGSSLGHWQGAVGGFSVPNTQQSGVNAVMNPSIAPGVENRTFRPFEIGALEDMGYDVQVSASTHFWDLY